MSDNHGTLSRGSLWLALASELVGLSLLPAAHSSASSPIVVVRPTALPTSARQGGEAMFLHDTEDGRTLLYVEQHAGTELAIFDVTVPAHVRSKGSVRLDAPGPFDFVARLGKRGELVRLRDGRGDAILDLQGIPALRKMPGSHAQNSVVLVADEDWRIAAQPVAPVPQGAHDYEIFPNVEASGIDCVIEIKQVLQETTNADTGTTFLLAQSGLYLIRRPALEAMPSGPLPSKSN